mmetsp:Transcript_80345/g.206756  ORF Transcript_80345/g.206756 Transcript_80345/m.206756 type:complete len:392 (-) Transcript_80345:69-1244(-)
MVQADGGLHVEGERPRPQDQDLCEDQGRRQSSDKHDDDDDDDGEPQGAGRGSVSRAPQREEGEAQSEWAFDRDNGSEELAAAATGRFGGLVQGGLISDNARAIAAVELEGSGGKATSRQLLDAAFEFACADEYEEAADLLEIARGRIDREQILRSIDNDTAVALDDECVWALANAYEKQGKLTLAVDRYGILKDRLVDPRERMRAKRCWAEQSFALACRLDQVRRYEDAERLFLSVLDGTDKVNIGEDFYEEVQLNLAMTLQNMMRGDEASAILVEVRSTTYSKKRRSQASFVLDVINVGQQAERNEEFHKVWEENFFLPTDSYSSGGAYRGGGGKVNVLNLSEGEQKMRSWATKYWKERLSSPAYYAFLTLFVTWPFAIPVVSILGKAEV